MADIIELSDLPELEFEEEVEILYKLLTKKEIFLK